MDCGNNLTWFLDELSQCATGKFGIVGQDDEGNKGVCVVSVSELAQAAKARIECLEHALTQVAELAERDSPFGQVRQDVAHRAKEALPSLTSPAV
jgi:hypothetical protein